MNIKHDIIWQILYLKTKKIMRSKQVHKVWQSVFTERREAAQITDVFSISTR